MPYLLALVGAITVAFLLWRAFGAQRVGIATSKPRTIAPDDDPDFLRSLREEQRKKQDEE